MTRDDDNVPEEEPVCCYVLRYDSLSPDPGRNPVHANPCEPSSPAQQRVIINS